MKKLPEQILAGTWQLGNENIDVYVLPYNADGVFYFCPDEKSRPRIKIGMDYKFWWEVLEIIVHETLEFSMCRMDLRFKQTGKMGQDHASYLFVFDHCQFTELAARQASFLRHALPVLQGWHRKIMKQHRRTKRYG